MSAVVNLDSRREVAAPAPEPTGFEDLPPVMTKEELAEILRVSTRTIDRLHEKKSAPARFRLPGMTHYRYKRCDVLEWLGSLESKEPAVAAAGSRTTV